MPPDVDGSRKLRRRRSSKSSKPLCTASPKRRRTGAYERWRQPKESVRPACSAFGMRTDWNRIAPADSSSPGTHDYKRNVTTTLFAALNVLQGTVVGECMPRHRHQEFLRFLRRLDGQFPPELDLHLVVDNYGTHKHAKVKHWLAKHRRFKLHFTPTSSSWLNLVERWFGKLTDKRIRRGTFFSVEELEAAIEEYLEENNKQPKPFVWTATVEQILAKVNRCKAILETIH